jgi:DNA-directed RNA polymerase subunit M/transcription elongation factor TFIIS
MTQIDVNEQWRELQENYAAMADEELEAIAQEAYHLTGIAQKALQAEISRRNLNLELLLQAPADEPESSVEEEIPASEENASPEELQAEPGSGDEDEITDYSAHCPRCHSTEIIFRKLDKSKVEPEHDPKFSWRCDACGYKWKDDGMEPQS